MTKKGSVVGRLQWLH